MLLAPLAVVATASVVDVSHNRHVECYNLWLDNLGARAAAGGEGGGGGGGNLGALGGC